MKIVLILSSLIFLSLSDVTLIKYSFLVIHYPWRNNSSFNSLGLSYLSLIISLISLLVIDFFYDTYSISSCSTGDSFIIYFNFWAITLGGSLLFIIDNRVYKIILINILHFHILLIY